MNTTAEPTTLPEIAPEQYAATIPQHSLSSELEKFTSLFKGYANAARQGPGENQVTNLERARYWRRVAELVMKQLGAP
jgi:hypothetical protein